MYLRHLDTAQRKALVLMAYRMIAADRVVRDEETCILEALRHELAVPAPKREEYAAGPDFGVFTDRRAKVAVMLKLASIAYSDREFHVEEVRALIRFGKALGLDVDDLREVESWGRRHEQLVTDANRLIQRGDDLARLPADLPVPQDDGACAHLPGMAMPALRLEATTGPAVDLAALPGPRAVIFCYPMTGVPGTRLPSGWDEIPGARGCTPQACAFRDLHQTLKLHGAAVFGLSTQTTEYQREMATRLHLPFPVLSDADLRLAEALRLPTFTVEGTRLIKRLTLVVRDGKVEHAFYPVFPPDQHADQVIAWLKANPIQKP